MQGLPREVIGRVIGELVATRPWLRFMEYTATIVAAIFGISCLVTAPGIVRRVVESVSGKSSEFVGTPLLSGVLSILLPVFFFLAARHLSGFASAISLAHNSRNMNDVAEALRQQKKLWKFLAICMIGIVLGAMVIVFLTQIANRILQNDR